MQREAIERRQDATPCRLAVSAPIGAVSAIRSDLSRRLRQCCSRGRNRFEDLPQQPFYLLSVFGCPPRWKLAFIRRPLKCSHDVQHFQNLIQHFCDIEAGFRSLPAAAAFRFSFWRRASRLGRPRGFDNLIWVHPSFWCKPEFLLFIIDEYQATVCRS
jgi:hypothetical protein